MDEPLEDKNPVAAADIMGDLCCKAFVVHEEKVDFPYVADQELLEAAGQQMAGLGHNHEYTSRRSNTYGHTFLLLP